MNSFDVFFIKGFTVRKSDFRFQAIERAALEAESGQKKRKKLDCSIL